MIDLRSDTVTTPTDAMRKAMADAAVGDDVFREDPTVLRLEEMAAERVGKEGALFVSSGTMANLVSQMVHCGRGDEMILGDQAHIFFYEQGGSAAVGGIHPRTVPNFPDGTLDLAAVQAAVRPDDVHFPRSRLLVLENTHNRCNGSPLDVTFMSAAAKVARRNRLFLHVDGARIFNAAASLNRSPAALVAEADSVSFCLSKGLCAPVGSLVCGSREFVSKARRVRKVLGGGMRQAGVIAAAGIVALTEMVDRLVEDHENARRLAQGLAETKELSVDIERVRTNIVFIGTEGTGVPAAEVVERLKSRGVLCLASAPDTLRAVTHYPVTGADIDSALKAFRESAK
jgi:threonine aldolase